MVQNVARWLSSRCGTKRIRRWSIRFGLAAAVLFGSGYGVYALITDLTLVRQLHSPVADHLDQQELVDLVAAGQTHEAFEDAFEHGDVLFETVFNALDGVGANVGDGTRFTRVPRADLNRPGQWAKHRPSRATGPNGQTCVECHNQPNQDGAGPATANVHRDPTHSGVLKKFIERNTPHVMGGGGVQRLAEEMTVTLQGIQDAAIQQACDQGGTVTRTLTAKGVNFGTIKATRTQRTPCKTRLTTTGIRGVDRDLVVKPFQWKGNFTTIRSFNRDASNNELGMQPVEFVGDGVDGDFDGVVDEMTIGDQTALAVYLSAQARPTTKVELAAHGLIPALSNGELNSISHGAVVFVQVGCATCHVPALPLDNPIFSEPSQVPAYRDATFPGGQDPVSRGVDPAFPVTVDLTQDQPDNQLKDANGNVIFRLGSLRRDDQGQVVVELLGDLKRHDMGSGLAEGIDEAHTGRSVFLTENLWGVGSTAPYLHDGRATTLTEAILEHGGEATGPKNAFKSLQHGDQVDLIAFLDNQVLFKLPD